MTQPPLPPTINPLDYAPDAMPEFLRRRRRRLMLGFAIIVALGVAMFFRQTISLKVRELYWARECARFTAPPTTPLTVSHPDTIAHVTNDPNYYDPTRDSTVKVGIYPRTIFYKPRCWREFMAISPLAPAPIIVTQTVFLHELRTPSGKRRIVHVESFGSNLLTIPGDLEATVIEPPGFFSPPRTLASPASVFSSGHYAAGRFLFGQPDPNDRCHFTIEFESQAMTSGETLVQPERHGIIDGYLGDDDRVTFRVRDPATTRGL